MELKKRNVAVLVAIFNLGACQLGCHNSGNRTAAEPHGIPARTLQLELYRTIPVSGLPYVIWQSGGQGYAVVDGGEGTQDRIRFYKDQSAQEPVVQVSEKQTDLLYWDSDIFYLGQRQAPDYYVSVRQLDKPSSILFNKRASGAIAIIFNIDKPLGPIWLEQESDFKWSIVSANGKRVKTSSGGEFLPDPAPYCVRSKVRIGEQEVESLNPPTRIAHNKYVVGGESLTVDFAADRRTVSISTRTSRRTVSVNSCSVMQVSSDVIGLFNRDGTAILVRVRGGLELTLVRPPKGYSKIIDIQLKGNELYAGFVSDDGKNAGLAKCTIE
ncbi:MAG: hypothetical protein JST40_02920 [Armatimonadetes bacterium]|nr:hypothetical protein [Armatimonadota bacterium]